MPAEADILGGAGVEGVDAAASIGHWRTVKDKVSWKIDVSKPGNFEVTLTYSQTEDRAGSTFTFSTGDQALHGTVGATKDANTYADVKLGTIEISKPGGPEVLVPVTRPVAEPKPGEVLIRIAAAGVNRADCLQRMGRYPMPPGAPDIPGLECSGTVVKCGEGVRSLRGKRPVVLAVPSG